MLTNLVPGEAGEGACVGVEGKVWGVWRVQRVEGKVWGVWCVSWWASGGHCRRTPPRSPSPKCAKATPVGYKYPPPGPPCPSRARTKESWPALAGARGQLHCLAGGSDEHELQVTHPGVGDRQSDDHAHAVGGEGRQRALQGMRVSVSA